MTSIERLYVYFILTENGFLIYEIDQSCCVEMDNNMIILVQYWYDIGILKILVLDSHVGIMALSFTFVIWMDCKGQWV